MSYLSRLSEKTDGGRAVLTLGGLYVATALLWPLTYVIGSRTVGETLIISTLTGGPGLVLLYGGYRLRRSDIRPDLFSTVANWCFRGIGSILVILLFVELAAGMSDPVANVLILSALASVAGLGMGYHDARAKTRARNAEEKQLEAERYETIFETVNDGIFVLDSDSQFTLVNDAYTELVGYDRRELLDSHMSIVLEDVGTPVADIRRDLETNDTELETYEGTLQTASGEHIEVEWTVAPLQTEEGDGHDAVVVVRDITERNEREQRLERQNERLDSFASMLAHELRNPVAIGQIYSKQLPPESDSDAVEYVTEAFDRMEDMIDVMLVVARGSDAISGSDPVQLADVAQTAWNEVNTPNATLEVDIDDVIQADETYVRHLFRNLFENSVEHGGEDITISVGELPTGFYVADDGTGISAADRDTVFEVGYTTAAGQGGTGLGLAFVSELADVYEWTCTVEASESGGARFEFTEIANIRDVAETESK